MASVLTYDQDNVSIFCPPGTKLVDLSFSLEAMSNNFCGRGVYRWAVKRSRGEDGGCIIIGKALCKSGPLKMSQVTHLGSAVQQKLIPMNIPSNELFVFAGMSDRLARDGQNLRRMFRSDTESVIESHDISPDLQIASLSYGFADMMTGLFALGITETKYQISRMTSQLYIKHNLSDERIIRYFEQQGNDYDIESTVETLP